MAKPRLASRKEAVSQVTEIQVHERKLFGKMGILNPFFLTVIVNSYGYCKPCLFAFLISVILSTSCWHKQIASMCNTKYQVHLVATEVSTTQR